MYCHTPDGQIRVVNSTLSGTSITYLTHIGRFRVTQKTRLKTDNKNKRKYFIATFRKDTEVVCSRKVYIDTLTGGDM